MANTQFDKKGVTRKSENISDWYTDVIVKSGMADYSPVKGCIVYRPLSYSIWEVIQKTKQLLPPVDNSCFSAQNLLNW